MAGLDGWQFPTATNDHTSEYTHGHGHAHNHAHTQDHDFSTSSTKITIELTHLIPEPHLSIDFHPVHPHSHFPPLLPGTRKHGSQVRTSIQ